MQTKGKSKDMGNFSSVGVGRKSKKAEGENIQVQGETKLGFRKIGQERKPGTKDQATYLTR